MTTAFENYTEAAKAFRANLSPRQRELDVLERFVDGTQYDGMRDFFDDDVPLWDRAPCIVYTVAATAIRSNVDLVVGESRFPAITSNPGEDDSDSDGLSPEDSKKTDRAIEDLFKRVRYHALARQALEQAERAKSCATIIGCRKGKPFLEVEPARKCIPTFDANRDVVSLEIKYPYLQEEKQADGKWRVEAYLYRRVIDAKSDTTFKPIKADKEGREPKPEAWVVDKALSVDHKLGFCPVVWYAHFRDCSSVGDFDGHAIHETQLDEIRGLDYALSMRHRAALFTGSPIITEIGVDPGTNPGQSGTTSTPQGIPTTLTGGKPSAANPVTGDFSSPTQHPGRKVSPGIAWQYQSEKSKVDYLCLPEGALKALDEHAADLRNKIAESLAVVILDPENVKHAAQMSGKAIEALRSRQFDRCDQIRDDFGDGWLMPVALMLLRVALAANVKIKSVQAVRPILAKFIADDGSAPLLFIRWPNGYLRSGPDEELSTVQAVAQAYEAKLITLRMSVQKLSDVFQIENVDQAVEMLEKEVADRQAKAMEDMQATAHALHGPPKTAGVGAEEKKPGGGVNGAAAA